MSHLVRYQSPRDRDPRQRRAPTPNPECILATIRVPALQAGRLKHVEGQQELPKEQTNIPLLPWWLDCSHG